MKMRMEEKYVKRRTAVGLLLGQAVFMCYTGVFATYIYWLIK